MIYELDVINAMAASPTITSDHTVIAEWNMNRYQKIDNYGIYTGPANEATSTYNESDTKIKNAKTYDIYDDDLYETPESEYFSTIGSVFKPDRPDPGIVLLQYGSEVLMSPSSKNDGISPSSPRFYPFYKNREYDYFNSSKMLTSNETGRTAISGAIQNVNPFVVYEQSFPCNKIVIKTQNHSSYLKSFYIDILVNNNWQQIYSNINNTTLFQDGIVNIYFNNGTWSTTVSRVTDINEIENPSTQLKLIKGIRLRTSALNILKQNTRSSLELIEISPRIEMDLSSYTEQFSINSSLGDGSLGLPIGSLVTSTGNVSLSNETKQFLLSSEAATYKMLTQNVEFRLYQNVTIPGTPETTYQIPLKIMYSDEWNLSEDFSVDIKLSDKMRLLKDKKIADLCFINEIPFSNIILMILDNAGITGFNFNKVNDTDDIKIKTFLCKKEDTISSVLEKYQQQLSVLCFLMHITYYKFLQKKK